MCDPMTIAISTFMVGAVQSVSQYGAAKQQAAAQDAYYDANKANADRSAAYEYHQNQLRKQQEQDAAGTKSFDNMLETRAKVAHAEVGAGEAGVTGLSVDSLINDIFGAGGRTNDRIAQNKEMTLAQLNAEDQGIAARQTDRINSVRRGVQPSGLALGLNIASSGLNAATGYKKMTS